MNKQAFYWTAFSVSDNPEADWFFGRVVITDGDYWLTIRLEDYPLLANVIQPQTKLDKNFLQECFAPKLGEYFVYHRPVC